jgi:hypothetical protein
MVWRLIRRVRWWIGESYPEKIRQTIPSNSLDLRSISSEQIHTQKTPLVDNGKSISLGIHNELHHPENFFNKQIPLN